jgi:alkylhydroperoxidase family enzyme
MRISVGLVLAPLLAPTGFVHADEPRPVPLTRPEMKQYLEDMKTRKPRIPLPELTDADRQKLGDRAENYEARLRYHYLGQSDARLGGGGAREADPAMSLDYAFKTELFWIVSRTNNCQYCLGHQEMKLAVAGLKEEEIAALDGDWAEFTPAQRAAFAFARKITYEPHRFGEADVEQLRKHYKDLQILEMLLSVAGNNSINRWKEGVGVPQSKELGNFLRGADKPTDPDRYLPSETFLTPTPDKFKDLVTKVAPFTADGKTDKPTRLTVFSRPPLEPRADVEKALAACAKRTPRLPLVDEDKARDLLPKDWPDGPLPPWVRLLANFPRDGKTRIAAIRAAEEQGDLKPLLKAQVSWIIGRQDRSWYAVGEAKRRLLALGWTEDQVYKLDDDWSDFTDSERALFTVARKLASSPVVLTDDDVARAVKRAGPRDVVQVITYTTNRASFDRITEAAGLRLEK